MESFKGLPLPKLVTIVCLENHINYVFQNTRKTFRSYSLSIKNFNYDLFFSLTSTSERRKNVVIGLSNDLGRGCKTLLYFLGIHLSIPIGITNIMAIRHNLTSHIKIISKLYFDLDLARF